MKLTERDIKIINYITENGATICQIAQLYFNNSYDAARKRLKVLSDNKFFNCKIHPVLGKKVYYKSKLPSYHKLVVQDIYIINRDIIKTFKREAEIGKYKVDAIIITTNNKVIVVEIDIFNKTKKDKIENVKSELKRKLQNFAKIEFMILDKIDILDKNKLEIGA